MLASSEIGTCCPDGRRHEQIADLSRAGAVFGLHAHDQVKQPLALNDLRRRLAAHAGLDHALDVGHVDAVARDFFAVHIDLHAGLAQLAHHRQLGEAGNLRKNALDLDRLVFQDLQILPVDFHRERALEARERLVHGVLGRLREVENHAGISGEFLLEVFGQLRLVPDRSLLPHLVLVRLQPDVELAIEKSGGIGAIVGAPQFRSDFRHLRIRHQDVANLRRELRRFLEGNRVRHRGAHPQRAFIQVRHEFAADIGNQKKRGAENNRREQSSSVFGWSRHQSSSPA